MQCRGERISVKGEKCMNHTRFKWLLTTTVLLAVLGLSAAVYADKPSGLAVISPTASYPAPVSAGNSIKVTFRYVSQPTEPGTTRAEIIVRPGLLSIGSYEAAVPDTDASGATVEATIPISGLALQGTYDVRLKISNKNGSSTIVVGDVVLVDNTRPGRIDDFGTVISAVPGPTVTWTEPRDYGSPPSGVWGYRISVDDGVNPSVVLDDVSAEQDADPETSGFQWIVPEEFADGDYAVKVRTLDRAGNVSLLSGGGRVIIDPTAPSVEPHMPVGYTNNPRPTVAAMFSDLPFDRPGAGVSGYGPFDDSEGSFTLDGIVLAPDRQPEPGAESGTIEWDHDLEDELSEGRHTVALTVHDRAGNSADLSWDFFVDMKAPEITPAYPISATMTWDKWPEIHATIVDAALPDGSPGSVDPGTIQGLLAGDTGIPWRLMLESFDPDTGLAVLRLVWEFDIADGEYLASVSAADAAGNVSETEWRFTVQRTYAPGMFGLPELINTEKVAVSWTDVANEAKYELEVDTDPGFDTEARKSYRLDAGVTSQEVSGLIDGNTYYFRVRACAYGGRVSSWSNIVSTTVDMSNPARPVMKALPLYTGSDWVEFRWGLVRDAVEYDFSFQIDDGDWQLPEDGWGLVDPSYIVSNVPDGSTIRGRAVAHDATGNVSEWSVRPAYTTIDMTGPDVAISNPTDEVTTNAAEFTYVWTATDAGCGVDKYMISRDGGRSWVDVTAELISVGQGPPKASRIENLVVGSNRFLVKGVDKLGNHGASVAAGVVTRVLGFVGRARPAEGRYKINEISTIAFEVVGMYDAEIEVYVNGVKLDSWRVVEVTRAPALSKYWVLLDGDVMEPGVMEIAVKVGAAEPVNYSYTVDWERSGFGFGRLRPW